MPGGGPVLLFDGVCNLCSGAVQWVIRHDPKGTLRFAALQSEAARALLADHVLPAEALDSVVLVADGRAFVRSAAALETARRIGGAWRLLGIFRLVPRPLRDALYDWVARHRYRWFGRKDECWLPTEELAARFLR